MNIVRSAVFLLATASAGLAGVSRAQAQTSVETRLATERFTIISPYSAGGPTDSLARILSNGLAKRYGKPAVVENVIGAGGNIALEKLKRAKPTGHTLAVVAAGNLTINPALIRNFPFDIRRDFVPVAMLAKTPNVLVTSPSSGIKSAKQLATLAKEKPGTLAYATPGVGTGLHMAGELLKQQAGIDLLHVAYKGTGPALNDVVSGVVPLMFSNLPGAMPFISSGRLVALGVTESRRTPMAPEIPTLAEQGIGGVAVTSWYGLIAPAGTPPEVAEQLAKDVAQILSAPDIRERLQALGMTYAATSRAEFTDAIQDETAMWEKIIKARNITAE